MVKKLVVFWTILVLSISLVSALKVLTVNETDFVSLQPTAFDEDEDELTYYYGEPLDEFGEWQTTYGDAGDYKITIIVSDGETNISEDIILSVKKKNEPPVVETYEPVQDELSVKEGHSLEFSITASDINLDPLTYSWLIDNEPFSDEQEFTYSPDYWDEGLHVIKVIIFDDEKSAEKEWVVDVENVDRKALLNDFENIVINEDESISLDLPDFASYNLEYKISEPLGQDNMWKTTYDDAGEYEVVIEIEDREFYASRTIDITVNNVDRPPAFNPVATVWAKENQIITIDLVASDPDGDSVIYAAGDLPPGSFMDGNQFIWATDYDTINKDNIVKKALDKFHLLYQPYKAQFIAKSNDLETKYEVLLMIKDVNRPPTLFPINDIIINEGEEVVLQPTAADPDNDTVTFSYEGWMLSNKKTTTFEDAGAYRVKVIASDGFLTDERWVTVIVNDLNREPAVANIAPRKTLEGQEVSFKIVASDPDGDAIQISSDNLPPQSQIIDSTFYFTPSFESTSDELTTITVPFTISDGQREVYKETNITIINVNRPPVIESFTPNNIKIPINEKQVFKVEAFDPDGDALTYTWDLGPFNKVQGDKGIIRTFTNPGTKEIKVTVSDGSLEVEHEFVVTV